MTTKEYDNSAFGKTVSLNGSFPMPFEKLGENPLWLSYCETLLQEQIKFCKLTGYTRFCETTTPISTQLTDVQMKMSSKTEDSEKEAAITAKYHVLLGDGAKMLDPISERYKPQHSNYVSEDMNEKFLAADIEKAFVLASKCYKDIMDLKENKKNPMVRVVKKLFNVPLPSQFVDTIMKVKKISKNINVMYNLYALYCSGGSFEKSIEWFQKSIEVTPRMSPGFKRHVSSGNVYTIPYLRPYVRAHLGIARCLKCLGRYKESLEWLLKIEKLQGEHISNSKFPNFRYLIPELYIRTGKPRKAIEYIKNHMVIHGYKSVGLAWDWYVVLSNFMLYGMKDYKYYWNNIMEGVEGKLSRGALMNATLMYPQVPYYLKGEFLIPKVKIPGSFGCTMHFMGNPPHLASCIFVQNSKDLWKDEWIDFAFKFTNLVRLQVAIGQLDFKPNAISGENFSGTSFPHHCLSRFLSWMKPYDVRTIKYLIKRGILTGCQTKIFSHCPTVPESVIMMGGSYFSVENKTKIVRALIR